jgi:MerR family transcriptional regulator, aldehyde-responsive regulator
MEDMTKTLERLDYKIATYEPAVIENEKTLRKPED